MKKACKNEFELFNSDWYITNVYRGTGTRNKYIYAELRNSNGDLMISATLDFIEKRIEEMTKNDKEVAQK